MYFRNINYIFINLLKEKNVLGRPNKQHEGISILTEPDYSYQWQSSDSE